MVTNIPEPGGTYIGDRETGYGLLGVWIPPSHRVGGIRIFGRPGRDKSELLEKLILQDISCGDGCIILDPSGEWTADLFHLISPMHSDRVVLLDWSDRNWIPAWNPLANILPADRHTLADTLSLALGQPSDLGRNIRIREILKDLLYGLMHVRGASLLDAFDALRVNTATARTIARRVLRVVEDQWLAVFWESHLSQLLPHVLREVQSRFDVLLNAPPLAATLSLSANQIDLQKIIDNRGILLVDLHALDWFARYTIASLILARLAVISVDRVAKRIGQPPLSLYFDEDRMKCAYAINLLLEQCCQHGMGLCVGQKRIPDCAWPDVDDPPPPVGAEIIFRADQADAWALCYQLHLPVAAREITRLEPFEAIAHIGNKTQYITTSRLPSSRYPDSRATITVNSHRQYYVPTAKLLREINMRNRH
jgi:hypothetical protein